MGSQPLADRIRPKTLDEFIGQEHLVGPNGPIRKLISTGDIPSMIFWGPPGTGKTTLARIIARSTNTEYHGLSAVSAGKADIKMIVNRNQKALLFLDEIHRFNKAQQDYLLPFVENGSIILIGATTENPSFEVISPLLSRCRTFLFRELQNEDLRKIVKRGGKTLKISLHEEALKMLIEYANGDARTALNVLEITAKLFPRRKIIEKSNIIEATQDKRLRYDTTGEEHYNTISAFIKSMRASNADAALYYLARMIETGEDPLFIARRMVIFASEDIGMAQPTALVVANEIFRACETIGYPECAINLAHGVVYLAKAPKNRASYDALQAALADVKQHGNLPIPMVIRNAPTKLMKDLGYGHGYEKYSKEDLLPDKLKGKKYYSS